MAALTPVLAARGGCFRTGGATLVEVRRIDLRSLVKRAVGEQHDRRPQWEWHDTAVGCDCTHLNARDVS